MNSNELLDEMVLTPASKVESTLKNPKTWVRHIPIFILASIAVYAGLYWWNPSWLHKKDEAGKPTLAFNKWFAAALAVIGGILITAIFVGFSM